MVQPRATSTETYRATASWSTPFVDVASSTHVAQPAENLPAHTSNTISHPLHEVDSRTKAFNTLKLAVNTSPVGVAVNAFAALYHLKVKTEL